MKRFITNIFAVVMMVVAGILLQGCGDKETGSTLFDEGLRNLKNGNLPVSYHMFNRAVDAYEEEGDSIGIFSAKSHLSLLCSMIGRKDEGYRLIKQEPYRHVSQKDNYSSQYYLRLRAYYAFTCDNDYKTSTYYIKRLLELDKSDFPDNKTWLYMDLANLAEIYYMTGQTDKAWKIINELEAKPLENDIYLSQVYYIHALLMKSRGDTDSACVYAKRSIHYSGKYQSPENEANAIKILMSADSLRGDVASYVKNRDSYDTLTNRVKGAEMAYNIAVIEEQNRYDLTLKEAERRHTLRALWFVGIMLFTISASVIIFLLYKQNKLKLQQEKAERRRLASEMEYKKLENELLSLKMEQAQSELEKSINNNAEAIKQIAVEENKKAPATRLKLLEATLNAEHSLFIKHAERLHPTLTHNDCLILGFMRMGLTSQEAAMALGISVDSLKKARYRLRKKMNMESMDELQNFVKMQVTE